MMIPDGYTDLPAGKIASIVTFMEMRKRPATARSPRNPAWFLRKHEKPELEWYRKIFRAIGQDWLWFSRLQLDDDALLATIHDSLIDVFALEVNGTEKGFLELDRRVTPDVYIAFFGVASDMVGQGAGRFLMEQALDIACSHNPARVTLHTCTLDHPRAMGFYLKAGFVPYKRAIELADDPRLDGTFDRSAGPQCPVLPTSGSDL